MNSNHSKLIELRDLALQNLGLPAEQSDYNLARIIGLAARAAGCRDAAFLVQQGELLVPISETASAAATWPRLTAVSLAVIDGAEARFGIAAADGGAAAMSYGVLPVYSPGQRVIGVLVVCGEPVSPLDDAEHFRLLNAYVRLIEDSLLLRSLSIRDPLTNLFNRRYLEQQGRIEWRRAMRLQVPLSFAVIDVDQFKLYNDSAGHHAGDLALVRLAELITAQCRRAGDIACRSGGEEFVLLMPITAAEQARIVVERIRADLEGAGIGNPGTGGVLTLSGGIATASAVEELESGSIEYFLQQADRALYAAKRAGRNCVRHVRELVDSEG